MPLGRSVALYGVAQQYAGGVECLKANGLFGFRVDFGEQATGLLRNLHPGLRPHVLVLAAQRLYLRRTGPVGIQERQQRMRACLLSLYRVTVRYEKHSCEIF